MEVTVDEIIPQVFITPFIGTITIYSFFVTIVIG